MQRKAIFILAASDHGTMIVNRFDGRPEGEHSAVGVGIELLHTGAYQRDELDTVLGILELRHRYYGAGVIAIDGGANIGAFTVPWGIAMTFYGKVIAIEPQERIFYALAGAIAINNCFNVCAINAAIGDRDGIISMPVPDYSIKSNFGGLSLNHKNDIGQEITEQAPVRSLRIDSLNLDRLDLLKLDIEGMEIEALSGAEKTIAETHPIMLIEHTCIGMDPIVAFMEAHDYTPFRFGQNLIGVHRLDKCLDHVRHLHTTLLKRQMDAESSQIEWLKFSRKEVA